MSDLPDRLFRSGEIAAAVGSQLESSYRLHLRDARDAYQRGDLEAAMYRLGAAVEIGHLAQWMSAGSDYWDQWSCRAEWATQCAQWVSDNRRSPDDRR